MSFAPGSLKIMSSSPELGEASEDIGLKYDGPVLNIGFNAGYILDVASTLSEGSAMVIELHGEVGPGKFFAEQDEASLAIVMPMRL